jgi:hypothetical protein
MQTEQEFFDEHIENELAICKHNRAIVEGMIALNSLQNAVPDRLAQVRDELVEKISRLESQVADLIQIDRSSVQAEV